MDILSHSLSGVAVASVTISFTRYRMGKKFGILLWGGFAAALPDMDALSLWSRFDEVIAPLFHLTESGNSIYFGTHWYSHHGFMHSLFAAILFTLLVLLFRVLTRLFFHGGWRRMGSYLKSNVWFPATLLLAYTVHLLEDMPTPASVWSGVLLVARK